MSGHSKWATIRRAKAATDSKRGNAFTKVSRLISLAAREGGDPEKNSKLRLALDKAKEVNMPKDTIAKAIKRGTGEDKDAAALEEIVYEGYGPGSVPLIVETITDNNNRTFSDVRHLFSSHGSKLGQPGSVKWMFDTKGVIYLERPQEVSKKEEIELVAIDAGAADVVDAEDHIEVYTAPQDFDEVRQKLQDQATIIESGIELIAQNPINASSEDEQKLQKLVDALEDHEDVKSVYTALA